MEGKVVILSKVAIAVTRIVMILHVVVPDNIMPVLLSFLPSHPTVRLRVVHLIFLEEVCMVPAAEAMRLIHLLVVDVCMRRSQFATVVYRLHYLVIWDRLVRCCGGHHVPNFAILGASRVFSLNLRGCEREQQDL